MPNVVAPRNSVEAPTPKPPFSRLTVTAEVFREDDRFGGGVNWEPMSCGTDAAVVGVCNPGTKIQGSTPTLGTSDSYVVYASDTCSAMTNKTADEFRKRAQEKLIACESKQIEKEFWTGTLIPTNPRLATIAGDNFPGTHTPTQGLAIIEGALATCGCSQGMIHMSPKAATMMCQDGHIQKVGDHLETCLGTPVVAGAGYPGTSPSGVAPTTTEYIYGTGPVAMRLGPVFVYPGNLMDATDYTVNLTTFRAERLAVVYFDPCCLVSTPIDVPLTPLGS